MNSYTHALRFNKIYKFMDTWTVEKEFYSEYKDKKVVLYAENKDIFLAYIVKDHQNYYTIRSIDNSRTLIKILMKRIMELKFMPQSAPHDAW